MYEVPHFAQKDLQALHAYMHDFPFAALVVGGESGLVAEHIPLLYEPSIGAKGALIGHVSRGNPLWREHDGADALAIFSGHQAYISPSWYASKAEHGKVVPTYNYTAVHARGQVSFFHEPERLLAVVEGLTERFEAPRSNPWRVDDAPSEYITEKLAGIVGVELPIEQLSGKWKLSQNRSDADRAGVREGLRDAGGASDAALADQTP